MKEGKLDVGGGGKLSGENVGFFLTGKSSTVLFEQESEISLTAPRTGDMAGLLFFEDRDTEFETYHRIKSRNARNLVGTMYFPKSKLLIDANDPVADRSDYTIIIAREFELREGPELVLNTDYASSKIPVPEGVGDNIDTKIRLVSECGQQALCVALSGERRTGVAKEGRPAGFRGPCLVYRFDEAIKLHQLLLQCWKSIAGAQKA